MRIIRPKTNAAILSDMGHTLRGEHGRNREKEGNLKLEYSFCAYCRGMNILKRRMSLWERD
jgi:hypothetical protein